MIKSMIGTLIAHVGMSIMVLGLSIRFGKKQTANVLTGLISVVDEISKMNRRKK